MGGWRRALYRLWMRTVHHDLYVLASRLERP